MFEKMECTTRVLFRFDTPQIQTGEIIQLDPPTRTAGQRGFLRLPPKFGERKIKTMITRSDLAVQLKEYQIRSKNQWSTLSFLSATSSSSPSREDKTVVLLERLILCCLAFSGLALYFRYIKLALFFIIVTVLILTWMIFTKKTRLNKKSKQKSLLPLSM
ncbi:hypothetical protein LUZ60_007082 [Juncus effusus]|nr:hypothetical protein LUZ60_007082 [Juncus effusus]